MKGSSCELQTQTGKGTVDETRDAETSDSRTLGPGSEVCFRGTEINGRGSGQAVLSDENRDNVTHNAIKNSF